MPRDVAGGPLDSTAAAPVPEESGKDTDCDGECMGVFEQCGGGYNTSAVCCDPEADCVIKNWFYAQCLTKSYRAGAASSFSRRFLLRCLDRPGFVLLVRAVPAVTPLAPPDSLLALPDSLYNQQV